jgi:dipeptidyl aminopeptidase/acylaminoacyl peptidase
VRILLLLAPWVLCCQVTSIDYERARGLREKNQELALNIPGPVTWIEGGYRFFWYRKSVPKGAQFVLVDAEKSVKSAAFEHQKLAASLSAPSGKQYTSLTLPFSEFTFVDHEKAIEFAAESSRWRCDLTRYDCRKTGAALPSDPRRGSPSPVDESPAEFENDVLDGISGLSPQGGPETQRRNAQEGSEPRVSPDGKWEALIQNYNVFIRPAGQTNGVALSFDGSEGNYYTLQSIAWAPDSKRIVAYRTQPGYHRQVHYVESSPADQLQPKHSTRVYAKPGDALDTVRPVLFHIDTKQFVEIPPALFPNAYSLSRPVWWKDGRAFAFEYNQRGHQVYRVIEVDGTTGVPRVLISEESSTSVDYRPLIANPRDTGKQVRHDVADGKEIIWGSERDGWEHLYLYDGVSGKVKNQITKGNWVVRAVDRVDEEKRQIWFQASGMYPGKDPYFVHQYRINFDGTGLTAYTEADGHHTVKFSADAKFYVDTWSRVDQATASQLRRTEDKKVVMELERGDISALTAEGWRAPEVFSAPGRDGKTEIWGVIHRPANFDASRKYPVVEVIYAGPQGSFVPKEFGEAAQPLTELGFVVAQIDGMGTNNRSKAFHEIAWKNLADAGFPDRILWHKAVAAKYPWYDTTRMGIVGNSAGGQNSLGALLFHPEFYKVAVSSSGCHDNRMDKIWWNEQWMSWPIGPQYAASSNVDHALKLQGKLLLIVGEMDTNVDPSSTFQVVNALIKAGKKFDLLVIPGGGHGFGGDYGQRTLQDFFVHHLLAVEPPDWNRAVQKNAAAR